MAWTKVKIAVVAAASLLLLSAGTALVATALRKPAAETVVVLPSADGSRSGNLEVGTGAQGDWHPRFKQVYALGPGELVKFVPKPFPPERAQYIAEARLPTSMNDALMGFRWDGTLHWTSATYGAASLMIPLQATGLNWYDYDDPEKVLSIPLDGDWILASGTPREKMLSAIADLVSVRLNRTVRIDKRATTREVIVITGQPDASRIAGLPDGEIVIGDRVPEEERQGAPNHDALKQVLQSFGQAHHIQVFDQSAGSGTTVAWRLNVRPNTDLNRAMADLARQTGLTLKREARTVPVWTISGGAPWRPSFDAAYGLKPGEVLKRVLPPFIPERATFWVDGQQRAGGSKDAIAPLTHPSMSVEYDASGAPHWTSISGDRTADTVLFGLFANLKPWEVDVGAARSATLPGDWVTRPGATVGQELADFGNVLSSALGHPVHFERRRVPREVIVARGAYRFTPLEPSADASEVIELKDVPSLGTPMTPVTRQQTLSQLFGTLEPRIQRRILDETDSSTRQVTTRDYMYTGDPSLLLATVAKQTSLRLDREIRDQDVWLLVGADGKPFDGPLPPASKEAR